MRIRGCLDKTAFYLFHSRNYLIISGLQQMKSLTDFELELYIVLSTAQPNIYFSEITML